MGVLYQEAAASLSAAVVALFGSDPAVRSVGIGQHGGGFGFRAVRNTATIFAASAGPPPKTAVQRVPVTYVETSGEMASLVLVPGTGPAHTAAASVVPERQRQRHLVSGLQIQNFDDDVRQGYPGQGLMVVGTLGCFVQLSDGSIAALSNNHVVAGENRGVKGSDRILQPGSTTFTASDQIAELTDFAPLQFSAPGASPHVRTALLNDVDAGIAALDPALNHAQGFLSLRKNLSLGGTASPQIGDEVFKVGRTTGLTYGEIKSVGVTVGPVHYGSGQCWFQDSIEIEGQDGTLFSDKGDSGSVVVKKSGEVVGLLYGGNGFQTYACPIDTVLARLSASLA
jgi:hypothetical protein